MIAGLMLAQVPEPRVSREFQAYMVRELTQAESRCAVPAEGWTQALRHPFQVFVPTGTGPFPAGIVARAGGGARNQFYHGLCGALQFQICL